MRNNKAVISAKAAIEKAAAYAGIMPAEIRDVTVRYEKDSLYFTAFHSEWMSYECYIDAFSGEVCGFLNEPIDL